MKRSGLPPRTSYIARSKKRIAARGPAKAKKVLRYKAYLRSKVWKEKRAACIAAAGGRCQAFHTSISNTPNAYISVSFRCPETEKLTAHHLTYARFGGDELPEDLKCLCAPCHRRVEALKGKRGVS